MAITLDQLRPMLASPGGVRGREFEVLRSVAALLSDVTSVHDGQEMLLRALEHRDTFAAFSEVLQALTQAAGLYPYLDPSRLPVRDQLAYEVHRPDGMNGVVFHTVQSRVYRALLDGQSVVLSAPTSFGKSLIIDAVIASGRFSNIVVIVPTIALIDETRRRLHRFGDGYKVITHASQEKGARNVLVLTQERANERDDLDDTDFFVIDEFYKLDPRRHGTDERNVVLNQVFYRLWKTGAQFYLLGPSIRELLPLPERFRTSFQFIHTDYATVASDVERVTAADASARLARLVELCQEQAEPTLIYVRSPAQAADVAKALIEAGVQVPDKRLESLIRWVATEFHADWTVTKALAAGIGLHHGRLPRALAQYIVRSFNGGRLRFLICTSTLIEGVNTAAKTVVVFDNKIATRKYDFFTFNNIRGRAGRMFRHFVGKVYLFFPAPVEELPSVDIPVFSQDEETPETLLLQISDEDLSDGSRSRIADVLDQNTLSAETLRTNSGFDPRVQIALAERLLSKLNYYHQWLAWRGFPTYEQLQVCCGLLWEYMLRGKGSGEVRSAAQLAFKVNQLARERRVKSLIESELQQGVPPDEAVEGPLAFVRNWTAFHFPRSLLALDRIQSEIFLRHDLRPGSYAAYSARVESQFVEPALLALEEYGIPLQVAQKLEHELLPERGLDYVLSVLRLLHLPPGLEEFERTLLRDARRHI